MRSSFLPRLLVVLVLVTGGAALAQQRRQIQDFQGGEMTQQQRDAERSRPKYNINSYGKDVKIKEDPVPWMAIGLAFISFAVAAPFAWRAYKGTTKEMSDANVFGVSGARAGEQDEE